MVPISTVACSGMFLSDFAEFGPHAHNHFVGKHLLRYKLWDVTLLSFGKKKKADKQQKTGKQSQTVLLRKTWADGVLYQSPISIMEIPY